MTTIATTTHSPRDRGRLRRSISLRRGVLLLEVVISIGILLMALAFCGAALRNNLQNAERADLTSRAMMLTDSLLDQLDTGLILPEREQTGDFTVEGLPGVFWQLEITPIEQEPELFRVAATIYTPDTGGEKKILLETHTLRVAPKTINLKDDFGMTDDQIKSLTDAIPGGQGVVDPEAFDPASLAKLDMGTLVQLLPQIMAMLQSQGGGAGMVPSGGQLPGGAQQVIDQATGGQSSGGQASNPQRNPGRGSSRSGTRGSGRGSGRGGKQPGAGGS